MAIRRFQVDLTGTAALLLSNNACSDPLSVSAKIKKRFTSKRIKADADHQNLRVIDWAYSGYWAEPGEVIVDEVSNSVSLDGFSDLYMPSQNFERCLRDGATVFKLGRDVKKALIVENEAPLLYDGPRAAVDMIKDPKFVLISPIRRAGVTNWVTRVKIPPGWSCQFRLIVDDDRVSADALERIVKAAGKFEGLGTWRPRYGRFSGVLTEID